VRGDEAHKHRGKQRPSFLFEKEEISEQGRSGRKRGGDRATQTLVKKDARHPDDTFDAFDVRKIKPRAYQICYGVRLRLND